MGSPIEHKRHATTRLRTFIGNGGDLEPRKKLPSPTDMVGSSAAEQDQRDNAPRAVQFPYLVRSLGPRDPYVQSDLTGPLQPAALPLDLQIPPTLTKATLFPQDRIYQQRSHRAGLSTLTSALPDPSHSQNQKSQKQESGLITFVRQL